MDSDWLVASNFERMHEVASAINTLSIHAKLEFAGIPDPTPGAEIARARSLLLDFLDRLQQVLDEVERNRNLTIVGTDPRLSELALRFLGDRTRQGRNAHRSELPLKAFHELMEADQPEDLPRLVSYLQELRAVIEEQSHPDVVGILGGL